MESITVSSLLTKTAALDSALCVLLSIASEPSTSVNLTSTLNKTATISSRIDLEES